MLDSKIVTKIIYQKKSSSTRVSFFSVLQQSAIRKHLEKLITQLINSLTINVFGVVSDDGVEKKVVTPWPAQTRPPNQF